MVAVPKPTASTADAHSLCILKGDMNCSSRRLHGCGAISLTIGASPPSLLHFRPVADDDALFASALCPICEHRCHTTHLVRIQGRVNLHVKTKNVGAPQEDNLESEPVIQSALCQPTSHQSSIAPESVCATSCPQKSRELEYLLQRTGPNI